MLPPLIDRFVTNCAKLFSVIAWSLVVYIIVSDDATHLSLGDHIITIVRFGPLSIAGLASALLSLVCSLPSFGEAIGYPLYSQELSATKSETSNYRYGSANEATRSFLGPGNRAKPRPPTGKRRACERRAAERSIFCEF